MMRLVTAHVPNRPGILAELANALADAEVNISGFSADANRIRILTDAGLAVVQVLEDLGIAATEHGVLAVSLADEPGRLAEMTHRLAAAGINIKVAFGSTVGTAGTIYLRVDDLERAKEVLALTA